MLERALAEDDRVGGVARPRRRAPADVGAGSAKRPSTWAETISGSVESGRPTPTRTRAKSGPPSSAFSDFRPLWPGQAAAEPGADLAERQVDLVVHDEHAVELDAAARRAPGRPSGRPRS